MGVPELAEEIGTNNPTFEFCGGVLMRTWLRSALSLGRLTKFGVAAGAACLLSSLPAFAQAVPDRVPEPDVIAAPATTPAAKAAVITGRPVTRPNRLPARSMIPD